MDTSDCKAPFARAQLKLFLDAQILEKLERLQQQEEIRLAELDDLVECPFCDFKAVCPPVELDREFRCQNPDCEKVSCRLCSQVTHVPVSCEEAKLNNKTTVRHAVEEAMTEALVRTCNKCKNKFIKEIGCNKMTCPRCGNKQCYICSETIKDYSHFDRGTCQMSDDTTLRHREEVAKAEKEARERLLVENRKNRPSIL
jgi:E3 ubiquitin-protein ligase RNF216